MQVSLKRIVRVLSNQHDSKALLQQLDDAMTHLYTDGYIAGHAAASMETWIPISEPPNTDDYVIVKGLLDDGTATWCKGKYNGEWLCDIDMIVTHWRPAPEVEDNN